MAADDIDRTAQKVGERGLPVRRHQQRLPPQHGVALHDFEFLRRELGGLQQNAVGDADLADVVKRRSLEHQFDRPVRQTRVGRARFAQFDGEPTQKVLGAFDVGAGVVVAGFGQGRQRAHSDILGHDKFMRPLRHGVFEFASAIARDESKRRSDGGKEEAAEQNEIRGAAAVAGDIGVCRLQTQRPDPLAEFDPCGVA